MNQLDFARHAGEMIKAMEDLLVVKGGEYAGSEDRLANFRRGAALAGVTPLQVAMIYASKHWDSISTYVRDMASGHVRPRAESMQGRFQDLANYMLLMAALVKEEEGMPARRAEDSHVRNAPITHVNLTEATTAALGVTQEDFRDGHWVPSSLDESAKVR